MSLVGDDVLEDVESADVDNTPATVPTIHRDFDFGDEAPPIPAHTMASMELVERDKPGTGSGGARGKVGGGAGSGGSKSPIDPLSSTYDIVGAVTETVYEQPEPPKCEL